MTYKIDNVSGDLGSSEWEYLPMKENSDGFLQTCFEISLDSVKNYNNNTNVTVTIGWNNGKQEKITCYWTEGIKEE